MDSSDNHTDIKSLVGLPVTTAVRDCKSHRNHMPTPAFFPFPQDCRALLQTWLGDYIAPLALEDRHIHAKKIRG